MTERRRPACLQSARSRHSRRAVALRIYGNRPGRGRVGDVCDERAKRNRRNQEHPQSKDKPASMPEARRQGEGRRSEKGEDQKCKQQVKLGQRRGQTMPPTGLHGRPLQGIQLSSGNFHYRSDATVRPPAVAKRFAKRSAMPKAWRRLQLRRLPSPTPLTAAKRRATLFQSS